LHERLSRSGIFRCIYLQNSVIIPIGMIDRVQLRDPAALGREVRRRRKLLKATQRDLAMASGTGLRFIGELEKGKPTAHIGKVFDVLEALGLELQAVPR
jgi:HTH-type transcriptional regulator/antitoxin HipB